MPYRHGPWEPPFNTRLSPDRIQCGAEIWWIGLIIRIGHATFGRIGLATIDWIELATFVVNNLTIDI